MKLASQEVSARASSSFLMPLSSSLRSSASTAVSSSSMDTPGLAVTWRLKMLLISRESW